MSIEYKVSQNGQRVEAFPKGILDIKATFDYLNSLVSDNKIKQGATEIVYLRSGTDFKISHSDGSKIAKYYKELIHNQIIGTTIFVCETLDTYITGRMLQTHHLIINPDHRVEVFRSESEIINK